MRRLDGRSKLMDKGARAPHWYRDAVIYELRVRSFADANGDGVGDFKGLKEKLPYLQDLGVTAIWLLPFYPSPGRDDGYDTADYTDVDPALGTLDEFKAFLDSAHRRGLRVITELVLNHTSDQHPWFQRARRAPQGSMERDFYVWSDTPDKYKEARIIFRDFEHSNWAWDPVAKQYFWHRFYSHQPDLNFESPAVHEALLGVVDFWLDMGVDGLRLDAVPYLYEEEGTNCENLPQTHASLKKLRAHVDSKYADRMLLAEANQWPEDAAAYFGEGDECHMNFHFPIMPRLFMAIHMEDRFPLVDILAQTPQLPEGAQWALFLRNHDELTLEMVTEDERDFMYRAYAHEPTMRINLGIRRRLAPLVGNDRRKMELMNALLMSLPGTPVLYYGDEIGMGDNVYLGDRDGVRTPMQWSADRNAGFSRANPQRLVLPLIIDPGYHYEAVNVETQEGQPNSLLWWTKRLLALRSRKKVFGRGALHFVMPENHKILAYLREWEGEKLLVVANLSRFPQWAELELGAHKGLVPVELFGGAVLPVITEEPYLLTLGGYGFYWFDLREPESAVAEAVEAEWTPPSLVIRGGIEGALQGEDGRRIAPILGAWLSSRRWFRDQHRRLETVRIVEIMPLGAQPDSVRFVIVEVGEAEGSLERYSLPLILFSGEEAQARLPEEPASTVVQIRTTSGAQGWLCDAFSVPEGGLALTEFLRSGARARGLEGGELRMHRALDVELGDAPEVRIIRAGHGHLHLVVGGEWFFKLYRRLCEGVSPEVEVGERLSGRLEPGVVPAFGGALSWRPSRRGEVSLGVLQRWVPSEGTALEWAREGLKRSLERVLASEWPAPTTHGQRLVKMAHGEPPPDVERMAGAVLDAAVQMGHRTALMHRALVGGADEPDFTPEPYGLLDRRSAYQSMRNLTGTTLRALRGRLSQLPPEAAAEASKLLGSEESLYARFSSLLTTRMTAMRTRHHGDLSLETMLYTGRDFIIMDFDGDSARALPERRRKRSPLRDVAGVIASFHRVAMSTWLDERVVRRSDRERLAPWTEQWSAWASAVYLKAWLESAAGGGFLPHTDEELLMLLHRLLLELGLIDLGRELDAPSEGVAVPLELINALLNEKE